jgi:hypothetical protein
MAITMHGQRFVMGALSGVLESPYWITSCQQRLRDRQPEGFGV